MNPFLWASNGVIYRAQWDSDNARHGLWDHLEHLRQWWGGWQGHGFVAMSGAGRLTWPRKAVAMPRRKRIRTAPGTC